MGRRIVLEPHLPPDALFARYKATADAATARRWQLVWLISTGKTRDEAATLVGLSSRWATEIVARYNREGVAGLEDGRHANPGAAPLLDPTQQHALAEALTGLPDDGGQWSGRKVAAWMQREAGKTTDAKRGIVYLRKLGKTPQVPRPAHVHTATAEEQGAFRKG